MKKTWRTINESLTRNKQGSELPSIFFLNDKELTNPTEIANAFNVYFANIGKNLAADIESSISTDQSYTAYTQYLLNPTKEKYIFRCATQGEVVKAINNLEKKQSSGHDGISNKVLKYIKNEIAKPLTLIINQMLKTGIFPNACKKSKITPLFKKGDSSLVANYRPISLLPTMSKIFEQMIHNQMYEYFNNNLLAEQQYGFHKLHSAEYAAVKLLDHVSKQMESGHIPCNLYIDLSKA